MDIKVDGLTYDIVAEALEKCRKGRLFILDEDVYKRQAVHRFQPPNMADGLPEPEPEQPPTI